MNFFFFKQNTAYEMRISDWSSDVCSSDLLGSKCGGYAFAEEGSFGWIASHRRALRSLPPALLQREEITAPRGDIGFAGQFLTCHTAQFAQPVLKAADFLTLLAADSRFPKIGRAHV